MHTPAPITFINVFEIDEAEIDTFIERWKQRSRRITGAPGFTSAELHRATDDDTRFRLINVTRWRSRADHEAATTEPAYRAELDAYGRAPTSTWTPNRGFYRTAAALAPTTGDEP